MTYNSQYEYEDYEELYEHVPAGVASAYRAFEPYPMIIERADGPYVHDVDGDRYIDYDLNNGAGMVGHDHRAVTGSLCLNAASFPTLTTSPSSGPSASSTRTNTSNATSRRSRTWHRCSLIGRSHNTTPSEFFALSNHVSAFRHPIAIQSPSRLLDA